MRILFTLMDFREMGGAQMYFYELSRALMRRGHFCTIISNIQGQMAQMATDAGIRCLPYSELKDVSTHDYDIIHASHVPNIEAIVSDDILSGKPLIQTCHSEIIPVEAGVNHHRVSAYIAIRKTIKEQLISNGLLKEKIHLIYNPIDEEKFNINYTSSNDKKILFAGSIDYLRVNPLKHAYKMFCHDGTYKMIVAGRNDFPELGGMMPNAVFIGPQNSIDHLIKECEFVVGIQGGRTKWEAGFCGKKYMNITVDAQGNILNFDEAPMYAPDEELAKYGADYVARQLEKLYGTFF